MSNYKKLFFLQTFTFLSFLSTGYSGLFTDNSLPIKQDFLNKLSSEAESKDSSALKIPNVWSYMEENQNTYNQLKKTV